MVKLQILVVPLIIEWLLLGHKNIYDGIVISISNDCCFILIFIMLGCRACPVLLE